ncbi:MAG: hypothetical protein IPL65_20730 [Lewinellaceae bacterium]|nr:hypothetical protein [Lewinellaceae bacterium]
MNNLTRKLQKSNFKIFNSPAIELNYKVYDPNFAAAEKKQLLAIFRLLLNEYLIDFFKWKPEKEVREIIAKTEHPVFNDRKLPLETYVGKHFMPLMQKSENFKHLVDQTDLRKLPKTTVGDLLEMETPINEHPVFHSHVKVEEKFDATNSEKGETNEVEVISKITEEQFNESNINSDYEFLAQLVGLSENNTFKFARYYKNELLNTKNAQVLFGMDLPKTQLEGLNFAMGLMTLTDGHRNTIERLFDLPNTNSIKDLAKNTSVNWGDFIRLNQLDRPKFTGYELELAIANAHPTTYVMARLLSKPKLLVNFLDNNPMVELFSARIDSKDSKLYNWSGISSKEKAALRKQIQILLRSRKLVDDVRHLPTLINSGYTSAHEILSVGRKNFMLKSNFKDGQISRNIYKRARKSPMRR